MVEKGVLINLRQFVEMGDFLSGFFWSLGRWQELSTRVQLQCRSRTTNVQTKTLKRLRRNDDSSVEAGTQVEKSKVVGKKDQLIEVNFM